MSSQMRPGSTDWSPDQYLLFRNARNRPIHDLLTFLGPGYTPTSIVDLGCGPGTSTEILASRFPTATLVGVDSSPSMLAKARTLLPNTPFAPADLRTYHPPKGTSLLFSNAVFHWLRAADRIPTITRLLRTQTPNSGGVLAFQVPANRDEPSHVAMREAAAAPGPWRAHFAALPAAQRPDLDAVESDVEFYDALKPLCSTVEVWTTVYTHVLEDHDGIVEWVKGSGLQPFLNALPEEGGVREGFLAEYRRRLEEGYGRAADGRVLLRYPRRFVVAFR
ncbi:hypothetical protein NEMBOFW57_008556 [Staphylotrichum longicolle]|uniref:Methyltransferase domain-containing protein n=1 Tax=Staphylotrichum longicolle TaxID=669026 RepID=A0AAD4HU57_9PEZI|nr:hypothetical protein NEMBOFW57_008556 [Staphylotrichum longicolle]